MENGNILGFRKLEETRKTSFYWLYLLRLLILLQKEI